MIHAADHFAEGVLEFRDIATDGEITALSGINEHGEFFIDALEAGFHIVNAFGDFGFFARESVHVLGEIAGCVLGNNFYDTHLHVYVRFDERIHACRKFAVFSFEILCRHLMTNHSFGVLLRHDSLFMRELLNRVDDIIHRSGKSADFIIRVHLYCCIFKLPISNFAGCCFDRAKRSANKASYEEHNRYHQKGAPTGNAGNY